MRNIHSETTKFTILSGTLNPYLVSLIPNFDEKTKFDPKPYTAACEMLRNNHHTNNIKKTNLRTRVKNNLRHKGNLPQFF